MLCNILSNTHWCSSKNEDHTVPFVTKEIRILLLGHCSKVPEAVSCVQVLLGLQLLNPTQHRSAQIVGEIISQYKDDGRDKFMSVRN